MLKTDSEELRNVRSHSRFAAEGLGRHIKAFLLTAVAMAGLATESVAADARKPSAYAHPDLLIEAGELAKLPARPGARIILDARPLDQFKELHLKEALHVVSADWSRDFGDGRDAESWSRRLGQLGIGRATQVVIYDDRLGQDSARIWWYLRYWGVCQAQIVNGGWKAVQEANLPTDSGPARVVSPADYDSPPVAARRVDLSTLVAAYRAGRLGTDRPDSLQLLDTRSDQEYRGEQVTEGQRPGTIPGARHLEWAELVDPVTERFRPTSEITKLLTDRGVDLQRPIVAFSNNRGRASSIAFPLELAGATQTRIFESGIKSWASDENNPVVKP